ncbi:hypothetical protein L249_4346 [Ophiocordyceps polyrhachis-furcata BCC 54312]|uniref:Uncharacterized protein n=1 Tax=Ophiocordyceps polyrhachis-furcata BCC 54312 TaxID=1330021 RepID=A0A367L8F7_9HYPO|nr:hypothetical protein L249_4346 [Ophiocordyceps polyrhachis-furcata BCC 54312]
MKHHNWEMLLAAALLLGVQARIELVMSNVPDDCKDMCKPIGDLTEKCNTELPDGTDADEKLLEAQCVCTNDSFDVRTIAGLCAGCLSQAAGTTDEKTKLSVANQDIKDVLAACSFSASPYTPPSASLAETVTVEATAPTNMDQLTTTLTRATELPTGDDRARATSAASAVEAIVSREATHASKLVAVARQPGGVNAANQVHATEARPQWKPHHGAGGTLIDDELTLAAGVDLEPPTAEFRVVNQEEGDDSLPPLTVNVEDAALVAHPADGSRRAVGVVSPDAVEVVVDRDGRQVRELPVGFAQHQHLAWTTLCRPRHPPEAFTETKRSRRHPSQGELVQRNLVIPPVVVGRHPLDAGHAGRDGSHDESDSRDGGRAGLSLDPEADYEPAGVGVHQLDVVCSEAGEEGSLVGELDLDADHSTREGVEADLILGVGCEKLIPLVVWNVLDRASRIVQVGVERLRAAVHDQACNPVVERDGDPLIERHHALAPDVILSEAMIQRLHPSVLHDVYARERAADGPAEVDVRLRVVQVLEVFAEEGGQVDGRLERRREAQGQRLLHFKVADIPSQLPHPVVLAVVCELVSGVEEGSLLLPDASPVGEAEHLVDSGQLRCLAEVAVDLGPVGVREGFVGEVEEPRHVLADPGLPEVVVEVEAGGGARCRAPFGDVVGFEVSADVGHDAMVESAEDVVAGSDLVWPGEGESREVLIVRLELRNLDGRHGEVLGSRHEGVDHAQQPDSHVRDAQTLPRPGGVVVDREMVDGIEEDLDVDFEFDAGFVEVMPEESHAVVVEGNYKGMALSSVVSVLKLTRLFRLFEREVLKVCCSLLDGWRSSVVFISYLALVPRAADG